MSAAVTPKNFLKLLNESGLVEKAALKESLGDLSRQAAGSPVTLKQLTNHLVGAGLITGWHATKLKTGKYKGFFLGKYKLLGHLGTGGMSTVYLAQHTIFEQQRAIKVLPKNRLASKTYLQRFYREGRAAASLNHKNIVRVYDIGNEEDTHYLVMEYVEGQDIYEMVKESGPLDFSTAIEFSIQALTGLNHAHENDLVHRDVKPANLLVTPEGTVKILDLGLALFREDDASLTVLHNEKVLGTADYLSPEQAVDSHNVDCRADIYSCGCTLYYMLTGRPPFHEGTIAQRIARHQSVMPESVLKLRTDCPPQLAAIVEKMMAKNPEERYQSCDPLVAELRGLAESLPVRDAASKSTQIAAAKQQSVPKPVKSRPASADQRERQPRPAKPAKSNKGPEQRPAQPVADKNTTAPVRSTTANKREKTKSPAAPDPAPRPAPPSRKREKSDAAKPVKQSTAGSRQDPNPPRGPAKTKTGESGSSAISVGRKPHVDPDNVSIGGTDQQDVSPEINTGDRALTDFVQQTRRSEKTSAKVQRSPLKNQLIMVGMVLGMLALLGAVLVLAMWLSSPAADEEDKDARALDVYNVSDVRQA